MAFIRTDEDLIAEIQPVVDGLWYRVVEAKQAKTRGTLHVAVVIYNRDGVSVDGCAQVSRTLMPRLEVLLDSSDISLEVGSPGIDRKIKHNREFEIFTGRGITVLDRESGEWKGGVIVSADGKTLVLRASGKESSIPYDNIQKAKLDEAQEVE